MNDTTKITSDQFMSLFDNAVAVDYAGMYMTVQDDEDKFIFLPNCGGVEKVEFDKSVINSGVFVNRFGDAFRFDIEECEWFSLLSLIKTRI
jgi:hypothetical protein